MKKIWKVLLIEDDPMLQRLLDKRLQREGYEVLLGSHGSEGLELAKKHLPELMIVDWLMPGMDGQAFCKELRQLPEFKQTYLIMLTALNQTGYKVLALDSGADDFITKPFDVEELLARLRVGQRIRMLELQLEEEQHQRALLEMAVTLGHEINNPLMPILGQVELLRSKANTKGASELLPGLRSIEEATRRIEQVVRKLIHLTDPKMTSYISGTQMVDLNGSKSSTEGVIR